METVGVRKISERIMQQLQTPHGRLLKVYDLTREDDIEEYLEWYRLMNRSIPLDLIDRLESSPRYFSLAPITLLRNKVQLYNAHCTFLTSSQILLPHTENCTSWAYPNGRHTCHSLSSNSNSLVSLQASTATTLIQKFSIQKFSFIFGGYCFLCAIRYNKMDYCI